jgi:NAD(P)-dependent dehydrogenase (short-subunit alcohol dehydrogenase family)
MSSSISTMSKETVLIVGATGNIGKKALQYLMDTIADNSLGVAAAIASLRSGRNVLAIVRNEASAEKLFSHVGTRDGIVTVQADVTAETGVQGVVKQVKSGKLPSFQHVYSTGVCALALLPLMNVDTIC